jgi:hypothetical protein
MFQVMTFVPLARALAFALAAAFVLDAHAAGRICTSADTLLFGNQFVGTSTTQVVTVTNCGDSAWSFTGVSLHPATGPAWHVDTTCSTGETLAPGAACTVSVTFAPSVAGETSGGLWLDNTTSTPDQIVTFYGRGVDARAGSAQIRFSPSPVDFGAQAVGARSGPLGAYLANVGTAPFTPSALVINGPAAYDYSALSSGDPGDCAVGVAVAPGSSCRMNLYFQPQQAGERDASLVVDAPQLASLAILAIAGTGTTSSGASTVPVVEFHDAQDGQYFLTADAAEIAFIDGGGLGDAWSRTGVQFDAWPRDGPAPAGAMPVCRFFGVPGVGPNSHFYTASPDECAQVKHDPHWQYEGIAWQALVPGAAGCAGEQRPVLRLWLPGADTTGSRHRYVTDASLVPAMQAAGWVLEGPVFCAPR